VQKQFLSTAWRNGGAQPPCASKRGPHWEAQAGSTLVNGTILPSGEGIAALGEVWLTADAREARPPTRKKSDEMRIVTVIFVSS
jgi:hypothetical protein